MNHQQWEELIQAIRAANDTVQIVAATLIPLMYLYTLLVHWPDIVHHFTSGDWRKKTRPAPTTNPYRSQAREVRRLRRDEPTVVMRDMASGTSLYRTGPRPAIAFSRLRIAGLRLVRERVDHPPRTKRPPRKPGRHRVDKR